VRINIGAKVAVLGSADRTVPETSVFSRVKTVRT
jgi:hypothetical protein